MAALAKSSSRKIKRRLTERESMRIVVNFGVVVACLPWEDFIQDARESLVVVDSDEAQVHSLELRNCRYFLSRLFNHVVFGYEDCL